MCWIWISSSFISRIRSYCSIENWIVRLLIQSFYSLQSVQSFKVFQGFVEFFRAYNVYRIYRDFRAYRVHRVYRLAFSDLLYRRLGLCIAYFKILRKLNEIRERKLQFINIWQCVFASTLWFLLFIYL